MQSPLRIKKPAVVIQRARIGGSLSPLYPNRFPDDIEQTRRDQQKNIKKMRETGLEPARNRLGYRGLTTLSVCQFRHSRINWGVKAFAVTRLAGNPNLCRFPVSKGILGTPAQQVKSVAGESAVSACNRRV